MTNKHPKVPGFPDDHPGTIAIKEHLEQVEEAIRRAETDGIPIILDRSYTMVGRDKLG